MERNVTCCFTGHRVIESKAEKPLQKELEKKLSQLIKQGFINFGSGGALGFDLMAAATVIRLKKKHPQIKLFMMLPCHEQDKFWNEKQKTKYQNVLSAADQIIYVSDNYYKGCMQKRNRFLVDAAACLLAYQEHDFGGTKYTVDYANKNGVEVTFLKPQPKQLSFFA